MVRFGDTGGHKISVYAQGWPCSLEMFQFTYERTLSINTLINVLAASHFVRWLGRENTVARQFKTHRKTQRSVSGGRNLCSSANASPLLWSVVNNHRPPIRYTFGVPLRPPNIRLQLFLLVCILPSESIRLFPEVIDIRVIVGTVIPRSYRATKPT